MGITGLSVAFLFLYTGIRSRQVWKAEGHLIYVSLHNNNEYKFHYLGFEFFSFSGIKT